MERLEAKQINGQTYYYYSKWGWVNGKCRRVWQKYLGKLQDIAKAVEGGGPAPLYAEVFQWGLPMALWKECQLANVASEIDKLCPKRDQGMRTGDYMAIAAINRAMCPRSKRSMWEWFSQTALIRCFPHASNAALASQRFWDHMARIEGDTSLSIWKNILQGVVKRENIDLSSISYDGTNFYTFIDTFNIRCEVAIRGKNKQGRNNLRQVSYALFCCADGHMPLFYDVYEGNRNDAKEFPLALKKFHDFFLELSGGKHAVPKTTLVFDKGNNSANNFALIDSLGLNFVGSVRLEDHKDLAKVSNSGDQFVSCPADGLEETKAFRVRKHLYGQERILVVTYNQNLFNSQWLTLHNDIEKAVNRLSLLRQKLEDRANGLLTLGKAPTAASIASQCKAILSRQYLKNVIKTTIRKDVNPPRLEYVIDSEALQKLADTYLGKNILITNRADWDDIQVIKAYRSQFIIEEVFKEMKDRTTGSWWPMNHWTEAKVKVHGFYCSVALLLRALALRRIRQSGLQISTKRMLSELDAIREVVNVYPRKARQKREQSQTVLTRTSELQDRLVSILGLKKVDSIGLG